MSSITGRTTLMVLALAAAVLLVVAIFLDQALRSELQNEFDRQLRVRAEGMTLLAEVDESGVIEFDYDPDMTPAFSDEYRLPEYFILRSLSGEVVATSDSVTDEVKEAFLGPSRAEMDPVFHTTTLATGREIRKVNLIFSPTLDIDSEENESTQLQPDGGAFASGQREDDAEAEALQPTQQLHLVIARGTETYVDLVNRVRTMLAIGFGALLLAMILAIRLGVSRGLRPVRKLAAEVASLDEQHLNNRVSDPVGASELMPVSNQLNQLLQQLEEAFYRERSFSGNVAHELRTPIAELRSYAEVGQKWPEDEKLVEKFFGELVGLADDMERTVVNLLMLSRLDTGSVETDFSEVDVTEMVRRSWAKLKSQAVERNASLEINMPEQLIVKTDGDKFRLILSNLFSNAISHSPVGSTVVIDAQDSDGRVNLTVSNRVEDLSENDLKHMFDRFWRKDAARTSGRHVGLGLSIVKALSDVLELRISPRLSEKNDFQVTLGGLSSA